LAPRAAGPHRFFTHVLVPIDFDLDVIVDFRRDLNGGEAGLPLAFRVIRADAYEPVNSRFAFQVAISHRPADDDRGALNAGDDVVLPLQKRNVVAVLLGPLG